VAVKGCAGPRLQLFIQIGCGVSKSAEHDDLAVGFISVVGAGACDFGFDDVFKSPNVLIFRPTKVNSFFMLCPKNVKLLKRIKSL
jgi:hypothetical protein